MFELTTKDYIAITIISMVCIVLCVRIGDTCRCI